MLFITHIYTDCVCVCAQLRYHLSLAWRSQIQCKQNTFSESWTLIWNTWRSKTALLILVYRRPNMLGSASGELPNRAIYRNVVLATNGLPGPYQIVRITEFIWINCDNMIVKLNKNYLFAITSLNCFWIEERAFDGSLMMITMMMAMMTNNHSNRLAASSSRKFKMLHNTEYVRALQLVRFCACCTTFFFCQSFGFMVLLV